MPFDPKPGLEIEIDGTQYNIAEHPAAPGFPFGQEGRAAIVYKLCSSREIRALKVFKPRFRTPDLTSLSSKLSQYASIPGLTVCRRSVLTPQQYASLLRLLPDLTYSVLMPWIDGPTWLQVIQGKTPFTLPQSYSLSMALAHILSEMEQQGIAHCDLSAANLMLPSLESTGKSASYAPTELVDVEQIFSRNLDRPEIIPSGSDGYAHKTFRRETIWNARADRFAGAVLISEILGWCDPAVRNAAWGEGYFDPQELQRISRRYDLLHRSISKHWGENVGLLLERAWHSEILADCPTFGEWLVALPKKAIQIDELKNRTNIGNQLKGDERTVNTLLDLAERIAAQGNRSGALEIYHEALTLVSKDSAVSQAINVMIRNLEKTQEQETISSGQMERSKAVGTAKKSICPYCENPASDGADVCPQCGNALTQPQKSKSNESEIFSKITQKLTRKSIAWLIVITLMVILGTTATYLLKNNPDKNFLIPQLTQVAAIGVIQKNSPSQIFIPTPTRTPSKILAPTRTEWPTVAPSPTVMAPDFLVGYLSGIRVTKLNSFDRIESDVIFNEDNVSIKNGQLTLIGRNYTGGAEKLRRYKEGEGIIFDFKLPNDQPISNYEFETYFDNGNWETSTYRRFGIYITPSMETNLFQGMNGISSSLLGNLDVKVGKWYQLFMVIAKDGDFLCVVWDPENPKKRRSLHQKMNSDWAGMNWNFKINGAKGTMEIDNLMDITFEGIKK